MKTRIAALAALVTLSTTAAARDGTTTLTWLGQAAFSITTPSGKVLVVDPWLNNPQNPAAGEGKDPIAALGKVDYILLTHGHFDHTGDIVALGQATGARLVTTFELGDTVARVLGYPSDQMGYDSLGNMGGELQIADGEVTVAFVPAVHSSGVAIPDAPEGAPGMAYGGNPVGYVVRIDGGPTIYHSGDTAAFGDMALIGQQYSVDVALLNIGGHFGMEPKAAAWAAEAIHPGLVIPHHYGTFPILTQDPAPFIADVKSKWIEARVLKPGEPLSFKGNKPQK